MEGQRKGWAKIGRERGKKEGKQEEERRDQCRHQPTPASYASPFGMLLLLMNSFRLLVYGHGFL